MTELPSAVQASLQKDFAALQKRTLLCYQCSKCTSVCPAFRINQFNPRNFILTAVNDGLDAAAKDTTIWGCRNCSSCEICPMKVDIPAMVLLARLHSLQNNNAPPVATTGHRRIFNLAQKIQAASPVPPVVNKWPLNHQKFTDKGKIALYTGLMPIWDNLMYNYDLNFVTGLRAVLEGMNLVDVEPAIPVGIKDSGHDVYYGGDESTFIKLAQYNRDIVEKMGIETLVVVNPEDYHIMKHMYPKYLGSMATDVVFWTDFLVERGFVEKLRYQAYLDVEVLAAYHDPCKLGRRSQIYDSPRVILENMPGVRLVKFKDEKELAPCCGVTAFIGCDSGSLYLRHERLKEARDLGVNVLVTTCPSCVSHYSCALASLPSQTVTPESQKPMEVTELGTFLGTRLFHFNQKA